MLTSTFTITALIVTLIFILFLLIYLLRKKKNTQINKIFIAISLLMIAWIVGLVLQATLSTQLNIDPIFFDYFVYIAICFLPVVFLLLSIAFKDTKFNFNKKHLLLFIIPSISLILLWTNNIHHLFYEYYSVHTEESVFGKYFYVHTIYTYIMYAVGLYNFIKYSIKNSGFFSRQAILVLIGALIPIIVNVLGFLGIITIDVYLTPITFALAILFVALAIYKFDFLRVAPIALQRIVDRMSDAYMIVNEENVITDFNKTFLDLFDFDGTDVRNTSIEKLLERNSRVFSIQANLLLDSIEKAKESPDTIEFDENFASIGKHLHVEINSITNKGDFLGVLILLKDITQHIEDMETIKENQEMLVEQERLASLGQMIGGISHNLKTPIMSIAGATQGLNNLVAEYDASIGDKEVTSEDHHAIAKDMKTWIEKINSYTNYMSDIISAVKGQAATLSESEQDDFTIDDLMKRIQILMKNELQNNHIKLHIELNSFESTKIKGNVNSLVQVINNMITNSIQSYKGEPGIIYLTVNNEEDELKISVSDTGCGMSEDVKEKLFKEMVTTKGKNGTGLGLFMSYSTIKGKFDGDITFSSEEGKGTTFNILLPLE